MAPPFIHCSGIVTPAAKPLNGLYEYRGVVEGRASYQQCGVSGGNYVWFTEDALEGPMWVVTPKDEDLGGAPESVIARSSSLARWPWEARGWEVCGRDQHFVSSPKMRFTLLSPTAEVLVTLPAVGGGTVTSKYRNAGIVNDRPAFQNVDSSGAAVGLDLEGTANLLLFWMPKTSRWMVGMVQEDGSGVRNLVARSMPDDGSSWASLWPWEAEAHNWEAPTLATNGLQDGDAEWLLDKSIHVKLASPGVVFHCEDAEPELLTGFYEPRGMTNGRVFYIQQLKEMSGWMGPKCLWFAEERGQWVLTPPNRLGNSTSVLARISSQAWWPWEAHLGGSTSPHTLGSTPFAKLPPWHGGTTVLASARADWEVADSVGVLHKAPSTMVELEPNVQLVKIKAADGAQYPFLGKFTRAGIISARPFFLQKFEEPKKAAKRKAKKNAEPVVQRARAFHPPEVSRYAIWYSEDTDQWVITEDFRLMDGLTVDAKVADSGWFPWEVASGWQVADGAGGFVPDVNLRIEAV